MILLPRVFLKKPTEEDCQDLLSLHQRSKEFHFPWTFPPLTEQGCKNYIDRCQNEDFEGLLICGSTNNKVIGVVNLSQIFYRAFQNAYLSYYVGVDFASQGLMSEGVCLSINYAFGTLGLHRIEANIQPENRASINLVERLGFTKEGFSRRYLKINGEWRDHERWALTVRRLVMSVSAPQPIWCSKLTKVAVAKSLVSADQIRSERPKLKFRPECDRPTPINESHLSGGTIALP